MGFFYFDETIQERGGFILGAFVYSGTDLTLSVFRALEEAGLTPGVDEFKSSARMSELPEQVKARRSLRGLLQSVSVGLVVVPSTERRALGSEAISGLAKIITANSLHNEPHQAFFDEGIVISQAAVDAFHATLSVRCGIHVNQDSRAIGGIQVADLAAHAMGVMLLEHQGNIKKMVKAGENSGYDPDLDIELGFELWASLRHSFFRSPHPIPGPEDPLGDLMFDVQSYGLHVATTCNDALRNATIERFGECYLGCIH